MSWLLIGLVGFWTGVFARSGEDLGPRVLVVLVALLLTVYVGAYVAVTGVLAVLR